MDQILHIFKKDARHLWPEIAISLALLAWYTHRQLQPWPEGTQAVISGGLFFYQIARFVTPALILFWAYLIVRVVQSESLVGDRQWWTTKPYVWWQLFLAKILFMFVFISVPLFHVQLFLLHHFRFPILSHLLGLIGVQTSLFLVLLISCGMLASLTRNMSQFLLAVGIIILLIVCVSWMANRSSVSSMTETPDALEYFNDFLVWGTLLGAILWQFARRNRWVSLAAILGCAIIASGLSALFSSQKSVDEHYPALPSNLAPLQIAAREANRSNTPPRDFSKVIPLQIPVSLSGLSPGTMVNLNGVKISVADSPQISIGGLGWQNHYESIWPEDQQKTFGYAVDRTEYEKIRSQPLHLHIELAFSEYQEADARSLQIPAGSFAAGTLGTCRVSSFGYEFQCFNPLRTPSYIARFDPETVSCPVIPSEKNSQPGPVSYAWSYSDAGDYTFDPELSPIVADTLRFSPVTLNPVSAGDESPSRRSLRLCPGAEIRLSRPVLKRKFRVQIDLPNTRLEDLAERIDID